MNKLEVTAEAVISAYKNASDEQKKFLTDLFGTDVFKPQSVMERVKTFEDAVRELGDSHPLVLHYKFNFGDEGSWNNDGYSRELESYLKLRIIVAALNEGWEPKFTTDEWRYFPWFVLPTKEEIERMDEERKSKLCLMEGRASSNANVYAGIVCSGAVSLTSASCAYGSTGLVFKTEELAEYAGNQFIEIFSDLMITK